MLKARASFGSRTVHGPIIEPKSTQYEAFYQHLLYGNLAFWPYIGYQSVTNSQGKGTKISCLLIALSAYSPNWRFWGGKWKPLK